MASPLLTPLELYEREEEFEAQLMAERSKSDELQRQLDQYRERLGE